MRRMHGPLRFAFSAALLVSVVAWLDTAALAQRLAAVETPWLAAALAITVLQHVLSAWRWRFTARRLGLPLGFPHALREYYLAGFLNQALPGGVLGDANRAWRHGRDGNDPAAAASAVILERGSGQLALALITVVALTLQPTLALAVLDPLTLAGLPAWLTVLALLLALLLMLGGRIHFLRTAALRFRRDLGRGFLSRDVLPVQLASSLLVVGSYLLLFVVAARAVGIDTPVSILLPVLCVTLLSMLIPVGFAGWGVREAAAALVWGLAALSAADGVAASVTYGLLVLVGSVPGALYLLPGRGRREQPVTAGDDTAGVSAPGRRARPGPGGGDGTPATAPRPVAGLTAVKRPGDRSR